MVTEPVSASVTRDNAAPSAHDDPATISPVLVREQLERILSSDTFKDSIKNSRFLRYVTEAALEGRAKEIKETLIGVSVYDRSPTYDPKVDTVVRSEARRLRRKLDRYFEEIGQRDPIRISLPKGAYVPVFTVLAGPSVETTAAMPAPLKAVEPIPVRPVETAQATVWHPPEVQDRPSLFIQAKRNYLWIGSAFVVGVSILWLIMAAFHSRKFEPWSGPSTVVPLTTFSGESYQPAISPNGKLTAFIWNNEGSNFNVYVMQAGGKPLRITSSTSSDFHPAWSPDGTSLVFLRVSPNEAKVMQIAFPGGQEHILFTLKAGRPWSEDQLGLRSDTGPSWTPDGNHLIVSDVSPSNRGIGLYEYDMGTHTLRALTDPSADERDLSPVVSPDAKWVAFARFSSYDSADLYVLSRSNGQVQQLTSEHRDIMGLTWQTDGHSLVFSSNRDGAYNLWAIGLHQPHPVAIAATGESAIQPVISLNGKFMEYVDFALRSNILKVGIKDQGATPAFEKIAPSTLRSHSAQFSPDGSRIAFVSDRSGKWELWVSSADGSDSDQFTNFDSATVGSPRWSPDGRSIAFDARPLGHSAVYLVSVATKEVRSLSPPEVEEKQPAWSPDGKWIYFDSNRNGRMQLWRMRPDGRTPASVCPFPVTDAHFSSDGNTLLFTQAGEGLWQIPAGGGEPAQVGGFERSRLGRLWTVTTGGIYFVDIAVDRSKLNFYSFQTRQIEPVLTLPAEPLIGYPSLSYSAAEGAILFASKDEVRSNLMILQEK